MPRILTDAPDLVASPDGAWLARLDSERLRLYALGQTAPGSSLPSPATEVDLPPWPQPAQIGFLSPDLLLLLWHYQEGGAALPGTGHILPGDAKSGLCASLISVPDLRSVGGTVLVAGASRILSIGPAGAVVAPQAAGADVIGWRGSQLTVEGSLFRGDVLAAVPAPDRRWLIQQRAGYEVWDPTVRRTVARVTLATHQPPSALGYANENRLIWTISGGAPACVALFRTSDGRPLYESEQTGRCLRAEVGLRRLVLLMDAGAGQSFLDLDVAAYELRHVTAPGLSVSSFTVRPTALTAEIIVALGPAGDELVRLPLAALPGMKEPEPPRSDSPPRSALPARPRPGVRPVFGAGPTERPRADSPRPEEGQRTRSEPPEPEGAAPSSEGQSRAAGSERGPGGSRGLGPSGSRTAGFPGSRAAPRPWGAVPTEPSSTQGTATQVLQAEQSAPPAAERVAARPGGLRPGEQHASSGPGAKPPEVSSFAERFRRSPQAARDDRAPPRVNARVEPPSEPNSGEDLGRSALKPSASSRSAPASYDGPLTFSWEVLKWSQRLPGGSPPAPLPSSARLEPLVKRFALPPEALGLIALLFAGQRLLCSHPKGIPPAELVRLLGPEVLGSLAADSLLRRLDLLRMGAHGARLCTEALDFLLEQPCLNLVHPDSNADESASVLATLTPGLWLAPLASPSALAQHLNMPVLAFDGLRHAHPVAALRRALRQALLYQAALFVDGLPDLSYPMSAEATDRTALRRLLTTPEVAILLPTTDVSPLGVDASTLPEPLETATRPLAQSPSAPLPAGMRWVPPTEKDEAPPTTSTGGIAQTWPREWSRGLARLEVSALATSEAILRGAYLASRDGAVLVLIQELDKAQIGALALALASLPVRVYFNVAGELPAAVSPFLMGDAAERSEG